MRIPSLLKKEPTSSRSRPIEAEHLSLLLANNNASDGYDDEDEGYPDNKKSKKKKKKYSARLTETTMAETSPSAKTLNTQKTFDSTDDLLASSDSESDDDVDHNMTIDNGGVTRELEVQAAANHHHRHHIHHSPRPRPKKSLWDCKAVRWPPHHPLIMVKAGLRYVQNPFHILEIVALGLFLLGCYKLPDILVAAHHRPIPYQTTEAGDILIDSTFGNPYHHNETIPGSLLNLLTVILPMAIFGTLGILFGPRGDIHAAVCSFILAMAMKIFVVACIKNYAGYFRPSFYNMCQFNEETLVCDDETTSARESFPSGHAATALASMTLVSLFLLGKVRGGTRQRGVSEAATETKPVDDVDDIMWTPTLIEKPLALLAISPIFLGVFIASSRVRDNWHHPADVICGGIIGMGCSMFAHGLWYPSSYSHYAGIPLSTVKAILVERKARVQATAANRYTVDLEA